MTEPAMAFCPPPRFLVVDPKSGFYSETKTFRSLRPFVPLPPETLPLSFTSFAFSLLPSPLIPANPAIVDPSPGHSLSYPDLIARVRSLSFALHTDFRLLQGDVAFVLSPNQVHVLVLYLSLLSLGVVVSLANPISTPAEISLQCQLVGPISVAFATSSTASKLPACQTDRIILCNFDPYSYFPVFPPPPNRITPSQYKSKSGRRTSRRYSSRNGHGSHSLSNTAKTEVTLLMAPMFHSLGFFFSLKGLALGRPWWSWRSPASRRSSRQPTTTLRPSRRSILVGPSCQCRRQGGTRPASRASS